MKKIFAEFSYGHAGLAILEVEEKAKLYKVLSLKQVVGFSYGRMFSKTDEHIHNNVNDAIIYLEAQAKKYLDARKNEYNSALEQHDILNVIVTKIHTDPQAAEQAIKKLMPKIDL